MSTEIDQIFQRLRALEERISGLEKENEDLRVLTKNQLMEIQRELVTISASQIQMLFENDVMAGSIASNLLTALQNALIHKASSSKNRKPIMLIVKDYVPKSMRICLAEDGTLTLEQQEPNVMGVEAPWSPCPQAGDPSIAAVFIKLAQSFGLDPGQTAYAITDIDLQEWRQSLTEQISGKL